MKEFSDWPKISLWLNDFWTWLAFDILFLRYSLYIDQLYSVQVVEENTLSCRDSLSHLGYPQAQVKFSAIFIKKGKLLVFKGFKLSRFNIRGMNGKPHFKTSKFQLIKTSTYDGSSIYSHTIILFYIIRCTVCKLNLIVVLILRYKTHHQMIHKKCISKKCC